MTKWFSAFAIAGVMLAVAFAQPAGGADGQKEKVQVERYEIDVSFEPDKSFLHARATLTLRVVQPPTPVRTGTEGIVAPPAGEPIEDIEFELSPHLKILEVTDAQGRKLNFVRSPRLGSPKLSVRLAEPIHPGSAEAAAMHFPLTFTYEGVLPSGPLDYITKDGILLRDDSRWYPAVDLSAFTQNDIAIRLPEDWSAVTSGEIVEQRPSDTASISHWRTSRAVSSRSIAALPGGYQSTIGDVAHAAAPQQVSEIMLRTKTRLSPELATKVQKLLLHYSRGIASYPHREMSIVEGFPGQRGAIGYSAPGFLVVSEDVVRFHDYPGYAPEFLPHEIAHQWFPIEVTLARTEDGWLAESLAEYLAWRYLAEKDPEPARLLVSRAMRDALAPEPLRPLSLGLKLFALEDWDVTHRTLYQRGLLVWRTLETVIGRERVDRALREYYRRHAGSAASIADFRKICEEISDRNLGWFFAYFIDGTRIPELELRRTPSGAPNEVSGEIVLGNIPPEFSVRVEMRLETSAGPLEHSVATRGELTPFIVTSDQPVMRITLDPDARIVRWTEAARRNRRQRALLAKVRTLERAGELSRAALACREVLALDLENLASNEQQIRFVLGRLQHRRGHLVAAFDEFRRVLELGSLDPMESDFYRAWSRVYRARIERSRAHLAAASAEAQAGLAMNSPSLQTRVSWPETPRRESNAADELRALARQGR